MLLTKFSVIARYNVLTPIALMAGLCFGTPAFAADQVIAAGVIDNDGVQLAANDTLTNNGSISNNGGAAVVYNGGGVGTIAFILNTQTGTIVATGGSAIFIDGGLTKFENNGLLATDRFGALGVNGDLGSFLNTGTMTSSDDSAVGVDGHVGSFINSGNVNGSRFQAAYFNRGVGSFVNTGAIRNVDALGTSGGGVGFNTDLVNGGAVGSFENRGTISAAVNGTDGDGVGFYDNGNGAFETASFFNAGVITGLGGGVSSNGGFGSFTNTSAGAISGGLYSGVFSRGPIGSFSNAGSIGSVDDQGIGIQGAVGSFSNSGSITSVNGRGAGFGSTVGDFDNSGTIAGLNDDGIGFNGAVGRFTNSGTIKSFGNSVHFGGGVATARNSGTIVSTAPNGGFGVRIDEPGGTFTNTGTIQGSIAAIGYNLNNPGANTLINSGRLTGTNGTAVDFGGGANSDDRLRLLTGSRIEGDIAFGGGADVLDFSGFTGNALLRAYDLEDIVAGDNLYYYDKPQNEIAIIDKTGITAPGAVAARDISLQLQNLLASQLSGLGSVPPQDEPLNYASAPLQSEATQAIDSNADLAPSRAIWGSLIGGGSRDDAPVALSNIFGGIVAGSHAKVSGNTTIGVLGSYVAGNLDINNGGQTVRSNTGVLGVYGRSEFGTIDLDYALIGGFSGHHSERHMISLGIDETATADYGSWFLSPSAGIAVPVLTSASGELRVAGRLSYVGGGVGGYSETGSSVNLTVGNQDIGVLDARFGLDGISWGNAAGAVKLTANAGMFVQSNIGGSSTPVSFLGQTQNVASAGTTTYGLYGGVGVTATISAGTSLNASLDGQVGNDGLVTGAAKAGLVANF